MHIYLPEGGGAALTLLGTYYVLQDKKDVKAVATYHRISLYLGWDTLL